MREDLAAIADRLSRCGLPAHLVERHVTKVEAWRNTQSKRLTDDQPVSASGHFIKPKKKQRQKT